MLFFNNHASAIDWQVILSKGKKTHIAKVSSRYCHEPTPWYTGKMFVPIAATSVLLQALATKLDLVIGNSWICSVLGSFMMLTFFIIINLCWSVILDHTALGCDIQNHISAHKCPYFGFCTFLSTYNFEYLCVPNWSVKIAKSTFIAEMYSWRCTCICYMCETCMYGSEEEILLQVC